VYISSKNIKSSIELLYSLIGALPKSGEEPPPYCSTTTTVEPSRGGAAAHQKYSSVIDKKK
jgi:hypothetical protein